MRREASSAPSRHRIAFAVLAPLFAVAALLVGGGCAELRTPPQDRGLPLLLSPDPGDPLRGTVRAAASDFAESGRALAGRPREAALAAARLEYLAAAVPSDPRFAPMPASVGFALLTARAELRSALGTRTEAPPRPVIVALAEAARALGAGDPAAAARALSPALFEPGGAATLQRLGELGPLPAAMLAAQQAAREMARLDADQRWFGTAATEPGVSAGQTTIGLGDAGY
ncbi:hypothetical protein GCM10010964_31900 [Caldovatus sediminis]|uniref:Uncharacterized protein n=1 Tax=Caldovatus sediminis TaxID=2041189 RepID=A0A8J2ZDP5_9PROT|nr:hypothetical protein [Caldovatus sediminis]GGG42028.1 hypothetical protein GCM10010964_31900 [Caldovatus sediminis]